MRCLGFRNVCFEDGWRILSHPRTVVKNIAPGPPLPASPSPVVPRAPVRCSARTLSGGNRLWRVLTPSSISRLRRRASGDAATRPTTSVSERHRRRTNPARLLLLYAILSQRNTPFQEDVAEYFAGPRGVGWRDESRRIPNGRPSPAFHGAGRHSISNDIQHVIPDEDPGAGRGEGGNPGLPAWRDRPPPCHSRRRSPSLRHQRIRGSPAWHTVRLAAGRRPQGRGARVHVAGRTACPRAFSRASPGQQEQQTMSATRTVPRREPVCIAEDWQSWSRHLLLAHPVSPSPRHWAAWLPAASGRGSAPRRLPCPRCRFAQAPVSGAFSFDGARMDTRRCAFASMRVIRISRSW
jgi:hypothetical protein